MEACEASRFGALAAGVGGNWGDVMMVQKKEGAGSLGGSPQGW